MKWKVKEKPKAGQTKLVVKWAFLPVSTGKHWIWLDKYIAVYSYCYEWPQHWHWSYERAEEYK